MKETKRYFPEDGFLSKDRVGSGEKRLSVRPLGPLSDLVIEEFPEALTAARTGNVSVAMELMQKADNLASRLTDHFLPTPGSVDYDVARLDVLMLYAGFAHVGVRVDDNLSNLIGCFSRDKVPALTYEDIVLNNPIAYTNERGELIYRDPRTFTDKEVGADEEHFYGIHQELEHAMKPAVLVLKDAIFAHTRSRDNFSPIDALQKTAGADAGLSALDLLISNTRTVGRGMKHFDKFRPFLNPIPKEYVGPTLPDEEYVGPSGAYSGTVHVLDLLIEGSVGKLPSDDEVILYLEANRKYIPQTDYVLLDEAIAFSTRKNDFLYVSDEEGKTLIDTLVNYANRLLMFRRIHVGSVRHQVPSVMKNDSEVGTGGISNVARFLQGRIERTETALKRFEEIRKKLDDEKIRHYF